MNANSAAANPTASTSVGQSSRDVTAWARYSSSNESAVMTHEDGRVSLLEKGESAIMVRYGPLVSVSNLVVLETGLITPPFGIHLFVLKGLVGVDVPLTMVYRGVMPFVLADLAKLALLVLFPALALWLPSTMNR